jgi:hypothetical protein
MCNLGEGLYNKGVEKGMEEGIEKGIISSTVEMINTMLEKNYTLDEALSIAKIDKETYEKYRKAAI